MTVAPPLNAEETVFLREFVEKLRQAGAYNGYDAGNFLANELREKVTEIEVKVTTLESAPDIDGIRLELAALKERIDNLNPDFGVFG